MKSVSIQFFNIVVVQHEHSQIGKAIESELVESL